MLQRLLGHTTLMMTNRYCQAVGCYDAIESHIKYSFFISGLVFGGQVKVSPKIGNSIQTTKSLSRFLRCWRQVLYLDIIK